MTGQEFALRNRTTAEQTLASSFLGLEDHAGLSHLRLVTDVKAVLEDPDAQGLPHGPPFSLKDESGPARVSIRV
jgi:hypothetical protein